MATRARCMNLTAFADATLNVLAGLASIDQYSDSRKSRPPGQGVGGEPLGNPYRQERDFGPCECECKCDKTCDGNTDGRNAHLSETSWTLRFGKEDHGQPLHQGLAGCSQVVQIGVQVPGSKAHDNNTDTGESHQGCSCSSEAPSPPSVQQNRAYNHQGPRCDQPPVEYRMPW